MMGNFIDLTGQRFGRWLVIKRALNTKVLLAEERINK